MSADLFPVLLLIAETPVQSSVMSGDIKEHAKGKVQGCWKHKFRVYMYREGTEWEGQKGRDGTKAHYRDYLVQKVPQQFDNVREH